MFLTTDDKQRINQAIRQVEARTAGELVVVIARASDDYLYIPLLWASLISLLIPGILYYFVSGAGLENLFPHRGWGPPFAYADLYVIQLLLFILLALLFRLESVKMYLVPRGVKHRRAHRHACFRFYEHGLHKTEARNGILIFVSVAEHHMEILADRGISDLIDQASWQQLVDQCTGSIKAGNVVDGLLDTIHACGEILVSHFPEMINEANQLPDHLIEID